MAASLGTLSAKLTLDTSAFLGGFKSAVAGAKQYSQQMGRVGNAKRFFGGAPSGGLAQAARGGFGGGMAGFAGGAFKMSGVGGLAAGVTAVVSAQRAIAELSEGMRDVDRNAKLADRLGVTNEMMQRLGVAANASGTDVEVLAKAMLHMGREIGSGGMPLDNRLFQISDALEQIKDHAQRSAAAIRIFGKSGDELHTLLSVGSRGIKRSTDAIDRFGLAISRIDAAKVEEANDSLTELGTVLKGFRNQISVELAPTLSNFVKDWLAGVELLKVEMERGRKASDEVEAKNTFMDAIGAMAYSSLNMNTFGSLGPSARGVMVGLGEMRSDRAKNARFGMENARRQGLGGAIGGIGSGSRAQALHKGSMEAAKAISGSGGNPMVELAKQSNQTLSLIERHTAAQARKASGSPLRPSSIGGGRN